MLAFFALGAIRSRRPCVLPGTGIGPMARATVVMYSLSDRRQEAAAGPISSLFSRDSDCHDKFTFLKHSPRPIPS